MGAEVAEAAVHGVGEAEQDRRWERWAEGADDPREAVVLDPAAEEHDLEGEAWRRARIPAGPQWGMWPIALQGEPIARQEESIAQREEEASARPAARTGRVSHVLPRNLVGHRESQIGRRFRDQEMSAQPGRPLAGGLVVAVRPGPGTLVIGRELAEMDLDLPAPTDRAHFPDSAAAAVVPESRSDRASRIVPVVLVELVVSAALVASVIVPALEASAGSVV